MPNKYLKPIYSKLFHESFSYDAFEKRLKMQKGIYLLEELGVDVGDFAFGWYKHGPYSQRLQDEMFWANSMSESEIKFSQFAQENIEKISKCLADKHEGYTDSQWAECLASLYYLKKNVLPSSCKDQDVVCKLQELKPHLNNKILNNNALDLISDIYGLK